MSESGGSEETGAASAALFASSVGARHVIAATVAIWSCPSW
jgi:hypothetical protein